MTLVREEENRILSEPLIIGRKLHSDKQTINIRDCD